MWPERPSSIQCSQIGTPLLPFDWSTDPRNLPLIGRFPSFPNHLFSLQFTNFATTLCVQEPYFPSPLLSGPFNSVKFVTPHISNKVVDAQNVIPDPTNNNCSRPPQNQSFPPQGNTSSYTSYSILPGGQQSGIQDGGAKCGKPAPIRPPPRCPPPPSTSLYWSLPPTTMCKTNELLQSSSPAMW